jgi:hypothetical protein
MNPADVVLSTVRRVCPDSVPPTALPTAAAAIYDTFVPFPRDSTRTLLVVTTTTGRVLVACAPARGAAVRPPRVPGRPQAHPRRVRPPGPGRVHPETARNGGRASARDGGET